MRLSITLLSLGFFFTGVHAVGFVDFFKTPDVEVLTTTTVTPEGSKLGSPDARNPVHYIALNAGYNDLGSISAGNKIPSPEELNRLTVKVLAKQGYLPPADEKNPPTQVIFLAWGNNNYERPVDPFDPTQPTETFLDQNRLRFLGGDKLGLVTKAGEGSFDSRDLPRSRMFLNHEQEDLKSLAEDDLYFIALSSYEITSFKKKKPVLYWTTRISAPSRGLSMAQTLHTMMEVAGPNLGRDTPKPIRVVAPHNYTPDIRLGPLQILSEEAPPTKAAAKTKP